MVRTWLQGPRLDLSGVVLADGSGLSGRQSRAGRPSGLGRWRTPRPISRSGRRLDRVAADRAAPTATLADRFAADEGAPPGVRAKTGRIAGALSLAGYAVNRDGHTFAFAVVANQPRGNPRRGAPGDGPVDRRGGRQHRRRSDTDASRPPPG